VPGSPVIVLAIGAALVGRVRYSAFEVERLRDAALHASSPEQRDKQLDAARDLACAAHRPSFELRALRLTAESTAGFVPLAWLGHHGHSTIGAGVSGATLLLVVWIRRHGAAHRRAALGF
jgi:hypothetical protein